MGSYAIRKSWRACLGILGGCLALPLGAARAAEIDLTTYPLLANTPNQTISIFVVGGTTADPTIQTVNGVNLEVETGDGGTNLGGSVNAPKISNVDLYATGAVFSLNNNGAQGGGALQSGGGYKAFDPMNPNANESQFWEATTQTAAGSDSAILPATPQLLATVTFDTTGFSSGTFALVLDDPNQATNFPYGAGQQLFPTVVDGFLQISGQMAPEPASIALLGLAFAGMLLKRRRPTAAPR